MHFGELLLSGTSAHARELLRDVLCFLLPSSCRPSTAIPAIFMLLIYHFPPRSLIDIKECRYFSFSCGCWLVSGRSGRGGGGAGFTSFRRKRSVRPANPLSPTQLFKISEQRSKELKPFGFRRFSDALNQFNAAPFNAEDPHIGCFLLSFNIFL